MREAGVNWGKEEGLLFVLTSFGGFLGIFGGVFMDLCLV